MPRLHALETTPGPKVSSECTRLIYNEATIRKESLSYDDR